MRACGAGHPPPVMNSASRSHSADWTLTRSLGKASAGAASGASRRPDDPPDGVEGKLHAERRLVERDLLLATDLVGQLFPRRGDVVGAGLRIVLAGEDLGELVLRYTVVLENARNARLDRTIGVIIGAEL